MRMTIAARIVLGVINPVAAVRARGLVLRLHFALGDCGCTCPGETMRLLRQDRPRGMNSDRAGGRWHRARYSIAAVDLAAGALRDTGADNPRRGDPAVARCGVAIAAGAGVDANGATAGVRDGVGFPALVLVVRHSCGVSKM